MTLKEYFQWQDEEGILFLFFFFYLKWIKQKEKSESRIVPLRKYVFKVSKK